MKNFLSPNAASLGKFGDVPVSLYNGSVNINIPIHKLNERGVSLDISLQYDASGVRVEDVPGWVGQNWNLNAGGIITRSVRGTSYDELNFFHNKDINATITPYLAEWYVNNNGSWYFPVFQRGYYYHTSKLNTENWNSESSISDLARNSYLNFTASTYMETLKEQNWRMDLEPDIFSFNFMGHSGHFFLGQDGNWKVNSQSNLKVICDLNTDISFPVPPVPAAGIDGVSSNPFMVRFPKVINKITLIDENGVEYLFDQVELTFNNILSQRPPFNNDSRCISSAFYLTKVRDVNGNVLYELEYEKGPWLGKFSVSYDFSSYQSDYDSTPISTNTARSAFDANYVDWHSAGFSAPGQLVLPSYLKKIKSESGIEIEFSSGLVQNALKYVRGGGNSLFDNRDETFYGHRGNNLDMYFLFKEPDLITNSSVTPYTFTSIWDRIKNKKLNYINIKDNSNNIISVNFNYIDTSGVRLFLDGINFNGSKKYKFDYNGYFLPTFLNMETDRLGYYNEIPFKFTTSAKDINYWTNELPAMRVTNAKVGLGTLSKINFPTGGFTEFQFEPHTYSKRLNENNILVETNGIIGGLRIKKIINSLEDKTETKEFIYKKSISSTIHSGNLLYNPVYYKNSPNINHPLQNINNGSKMISRSINSLSTMVNLMGVQVEYTDVIEKTSGNGYIHHKFSNSEEFLNINPNILESSGQLFVPNTHLGYERGKLKEKLIYKETGELLRKHRYVYYAQNSLKINAININFNYRVVGSGQIFWFLPYAAGYHIPYTDKMLTEEWVEDYTPTGTISTFKSNRFIRYPDSSLSIVNNGSIYLKSEYQKSSDSNLGVLKTFNYPFEFSNTLETTMISKNFFPKIQEKNENVAGDPYNPNIIKTLDETKIDFQLLGQNKILPKEIFTKKGDGFLEKELIYSKYDNKGNLTEYLKPNGIVTSIIWGYNKTRPIAILENIANQNIAQLTIDQLSTLSELDVDNGMGGISESALRTALQTLRTTYPQAMIKTYTYDPLPGITSMSDYDGQLQYYEFDSLSRLIRVRDNMGAIVKEYEYKYKESQ